MSEQEGQDLPSFRYELEKQPPKPGVGPGGTTRQASAHEFPVSTGIAGVSMRLGWTGFFLALTGTTLLLARACLLILDPDLAFGSFWALPRWLLIYGYVLLGIATIEAK